MRGLRCTAMVCCLLFAGCSAKSRVDTSKDVPATTAPDAETVLITYHVLPGKEPELRQILSDIWDVYRREKLVFADPHVIVEGEDGAGHKRLIELFTWVSHSAPDNAPDSVKQMWSQMQACCAKRDDRPGI